MKVIKKAAVKAVGKRERGRPKVEDPKATMTIRLSGEQAAEIDAWDEQNGRNGRTAAIRALIARGLRSDAPPKSTA